MHSSCRHGPPLGWPLARRLPQPTQPREAQSGFGQKCIEVSTWRRRPREGTMRGGGHAGGCGRGSVLCAQASQGGLVVVPQRVGRTLALEPWGWGLQCRWGQGGDAGPCPLESEAQPHQGNQYQLVGKESGDHGKTPSYSGSSPHSKVLEVSYVAVFTEVSIQTEVFFFVDTRTPDREKALGS